MKTSFLTIIMLIGMMGSAQEIPRLLKVECKPAGEDTTFLKYELIYNQNGLETVVYADSISGEWCLYFYSDDTLGSKITDKGLVFYQHKVFQNQIVELVGDDQIKYNVNSDYQITDYWTYFNNVWFDYEYEWGSDNLQNIHRNDSIMLFCLCSPTYKNPFYDMNKTFRIGPWSSYDFPVTIFDDINDTHLINLEFRGYLDGYPTEIDYYDNSDNLLYTEYFIYDTNTGIDNSLPSVPYTVLSVDYFDLMGRRISKPSQGFYIERKITDKGVISTKYFIQ